MIMSQIEGDVWEGSWEPGCYWCGREAFGTARDHNNIPRYTCGGHGEEEDDE